MHRNWTKQLLTTLSPEIVVVPLRILFLAADRGGHMKTDQRVMLIFLFNSVAIAELRPQHL